MPSLFRVVLALSVATLAPQAHCALSVEPPPEPDCVQEYWVANTRCAPPCRDLESGFDAILYRQYFSRHRYRDATREDLLAADPTLPTIIYVHGNYYETEEALDAGWMIFQQLRRCGGSFRMVFWTWPSQKVTRRHIRDFRLKAERAEAQGYYVARLIDVMPAAAPITVSGHSYGTITASAAMHYLGGGELCGRIVPRRPESERAPLRVAAVAAAMDDVALLPCGRYSRALDAVERYLIVLNPDDALLPFWKRISPCDRPALSLDGIPCPWELGPNAAKVEYFTATPYVGRSHGYEAYFRSPQVVARLKQFYLAPSNPTAVHPLDDTGPQLAP